jgi:biopolymer transport protein ExbD
MTPASGPPPRLANERPRRRTLISLTALIDVVFNLILFFMLASSLTNWRSIALEAPAAGAATGRLEGAVLVQLRPGGELRLAGQAMPLEQVARRLQAQLAERPDLRVMVQPAAGVPLQALVGVIDALTQTGARHLALVQAPER